MTICQVEIAIIDHIRFLYINTLPYYFITYGFIEQTVNSASRIITYVLHYCYLNQSAKDRQIIIKDCHPQN